MNSGFYKDLDTNFEQACILSEQDFSKEEIISMLKTGNIPQKQIAALKIDSLDSKEDADALISNLTGCDGKIREAVALKINKLVQMSDVARNLYDENYAKIFANATIDINANICRLVVDTIPFLIENSDFSEIYLECIVKFTQEAFDCLDKIVFRDKKYVKNKQLFKLYWCLEALKIYVDKMDETLLFSILNRAVKEKEYTIREKVAQILALSRKKCYSSLVLQLKNDENYYVREAIKSS